MAKHYTATDPISGRVIARSTASRTYQAVAFLTDKRTGERCSAGFSGSAELAAKAARAEIGRGWATGPVSIVATVEHATKRAADAAWAASAQAQADRLAAAVEAVEAGRTVPGTMAARLELQAQAQAAGQVAQAAQELARTPTAELTSAPARIGQAVARAAAATQVDAELRVHRVGAGLAKAANMAQAQGQRAQLDLLAELHAAQRTVQAAGASQVAAERVGDQLLAAAWGHVADGYQELCQAIRAQAERVGEGLELDRTEITAWAELARMAQGAAERAQAQADARQAEARQAQLRRAGARGRQAAQELAARRAAQAEQADREAAARSGGIFRIIGGPDVPSIARGDTWAASQVTGPELAQVTPAQAEELRPHSPGAGCSCSLCVTARGAWNDLGRAEEHLGYSRRRVAVAERQLARERSELVKAAQAAEQAQAAYQAAQDRISEGEA